MYPNDLDAIDWDVIDFRDMISNINNMYFQIGPLPPIFRKFNATDTKTPKGSRNNEYSDQPSSKKYRKSKGPKVQNESTLSEWIIK